MAAVKPLNNFYINKLGVTTLESLCEDLPTEGIDNEDEDVVSEGYMAPLQTDVSSTIPTGRDDAEMVTDKPKSSWKRKVYPTSVVHRSARVRQKKRFHDDI